MMLLTIAALLQAAQGAPAAGAATAGPAPAWRVAGRAWGACVKGRIDARLASSDAPAALADSAIAGCAQQLEAVRRAIAAQQGDAVAASNVERVRSGGRSMFLTYIANARGRAAGAAATAPAPAAH